MRHEIRAEIDIEAPPDQVWGHLADLRAALRVAAGEQ